MASQTPDDILAKSFRIIDAEVGTHAFTTLNGPSCGE